MRERLDQAELQRRIPAGWQLQVVDETGSTNADLLAAAVQGAPARTALVAELQTQGRGRLDRSWVSPAGAGLTVSVLYRPAAPPSSWGWLPLLAGLALAGAIEDRLAPRLKWPNDVVLGPRELKVAGILAQSSGGAAVIGMGTNVSNTAEELPVPGATSLALAGGSAPDRASLLIALLSGLDRELARWEAARGDAAAAGLAADYRARCATIGSEVRVELAGRSVSGLAVAVDDDGRLLVRPAAGGEPLPVSAGDVTHVRPGNR